MGSIILVEIRLIKVTAFLFLAHVLESESRGLAKGRGWNVSGRAGSCPWEMHGRNGLIFVGE